MGNVRSFSSTISPEFIHCSVGSRFMRMLTISRGGGAVAIEIAEKSRLVILPFRICGLKCKSFRKKFAISVPISAAPANTVFIENIAIQINTNNIGVSPGLECNIKTFFHEYTW